MIERLIESQRKYFGSGFTLDVKTRLGYLKKLKNAIKQRESKLCECLYYDLGKTASEAYMTEIGMVLEELSLFIKRLKGWAKPKKAKTPIAQFPSSGYVLPSPYGCTLIISPWNYPFLLSVQPLIGAVAAGNTVLLKPSKLSEHTSKAIKELIESVFPEGYAAVVYEGEGVGSKLLEYKFDYIFFTGGADTGRSVYQKAAKNLTPVTLELGGKSPAIVDKTAKTHLAAKRIVWGKFLNAGQTCVAPDYVLVHESVADTFSASIKKWTDKLFPDALNNPGHGKIINRRHFERLKNLLEGNIVYGGNYNENALKIQPTVIYPASPEDKAMSEEIFGPVLPVIKYSDESEIYDIIDRHPSPLALYLFTCDKNVRHRILAKVRFGGGCVNDTVVHLTAPALPFGGVGNSGTGSYHGKKSFDTFTHYKSVLKKSIRLDLPVRYPPFKKLKDKLIKFFMK